MSNAMRSGKRVLAGVAAGALGAALIPFMGVGSANATITRLTASSFVTAATAATTPGSGTQINNNMALISISADDSFTTAASQSYVSIRLDGAPVDDTGTGTVGLQISANSSAATTGSGVALSPAGTVVGSGSTTPLITLQGSASNYLNVGDVVVMQNRYAPASSTDNAASMVLFGTAPKAGTYNFTAWLNSSASNLSTLEPGEPVTSGTITVGGTPASFTMTPATASIGQGQTANFSVTATDSAGRATFPTSLNGSTGSFGAIFSTPAGLSITASGTTANNEGKLNGNAFRSALVTASVSNAAGLATTQGTGRVTVSSTTANTYTLTVGPGGNLPGTVTPAASSVVVQPVVALASALVTGPAASSSNATEFIPPVSIPATASATGTLYVPPTQSTVTFRMTAGSGSTPGQLLPYTVADSSSVSTRAGVTAGAFTAVIDSNLRATITVPASAAANGDNYTVTLGESGVSQVVYTVNYANPVLDIANLTTNPPVGSTSFAKTATTADIAAEVTDQYGQPLQNITVRAIPSVSAAVSAVTDATGAASLTLAAPAATVTSQSVVFTVAAPLGSASLPSSPANTILYNASGAPASLTATTTAGNTVATAAATQYVDTSGSAAGTWAPTSPNFTYWMAVTATVGGGVNGVPVTFSAPNTYFAPSGSTSNTLTSATTKAGSITAVTAGAGTVTVLAKATKTGTVTVTLTAGALTQNITWKVANQASDARVIAVTPAKQDAAGVAQVTAAVTDAFGNPVGNAALNFSETGVGNFASGTSTLTTATGPLGSVTVDVVSTQAGDSAVTVLAGATANYAGLAGTPIAGAPAGVSSGLAEIKFLSGGNRSITIAGGRTTVGGKPGIVVDGVVTGIPDGKTVKPFFRFPGQTTFTEGSARPVISGGSFEWQRKTGKKFYAYVTSDDGAVQSNRVIIAAN